MTEHKNDSRAGRGRLNRYQLEAVLDDSPACVVNACVGSGKTTVLIEKIIYLHEEKKVPLENMVVLTFTNKAAGEITERLHTREPGIRQEQTECFGTFHSVAMRLLKNYLPVEQAGWNWEFTVMDPDEETDLAMDIIGERGLKVKYKNRLKKRLEQEYQGWIAGKEESRYKDDLFRLYPILEEEKKRQNKMSFSDLLRVSTELLLAGTERMQGMSGADAVKTDGMSGTGKEEPGKEELGKEEPEEKLFHPQWIIVDEVQDSDAMQMDFLAALTEYSVPYGGARLFAVGDPNQVIYSWRGTGENMFFLLKHRFGAKELTLPVNYRSGGAILEAAGRFRQFGDEIRSSRDMGDLITVKNHYDPFQEAEYLAQRIVQLHGEGKAYGDIAVFYRLQKQSEMLEKTFARHGIPYELSVKRTLKDIPVLNWLIKVLRFSVSPEDEQTGSGVLCDGRYGEKYTRKKAQKIIREQVHGAAPLYDRMAGFREWADRNAGADQTEFPGKIFEYLGLREALHPTSAEYEEEERLVLDFLGQMCRIICAAPDKAGEGETFSADMENAGRDVSIPSRIREYLNRSALYGMKIDAGECQTTPVKEDIDTVKLMTLHASKGLEFDTVFIIGVNQGLIPLRCRSYEQEEEERRLFFVGMTRAKNELELSWYTSPGEPGVLGEYSRYLKMIPDRLLRWDGRRTEEGKRENLQQMRRMVQERIRKKDDAEKNLQKNTAGADRGGKKDRESDSLQTHANAEAEANEEMETGQGQPELVIRVRHRKYGEGVLVMQDEMNIEAEFPGYGRKKFLKAFGDLEFL